MAKVFVLSNHVLWRKWLSFIKLKRLSWFIMHSLVTWL